MSYVDPRWAHRLAKLALAESQRNRMVYGNTDIVISNRNMRDGKCMGDVMGAFKRATESGRAASQWVKPKMGRKGKIVSRSALRTSWPVDGI